MLTQRPGTLATAQILPASLLDGAPAAWLPPVSGMLEDQHALCEELDGLGAEQSDHVASGRTDELLAILSRRQGILDRIVEISAALEPFRERREALLATLAPAERDGLCRRIDAIADLVERVRRRDDQDRRLLEEQRQIVADEISGLSRLRGAAAAYAGAGPRAAEAASPRFHDRHG